MQQDITRTSRSSIVESIRRPRVPSILFYSIATVILTVVSILVIRSLDLQTDLAIAVVGSLVGGFLGALLASTLVMDMTMRMQASDRGEGGSTPPSIS